MAWTYISSGGDKMQLCAEVTERQDYHDIRKVVEVATSRCGRTKEAVDF